MHALFLSIYQICRNNIIDGLNDGLICFENPKGHVKHMSIKLPPTKLCTSLPLGRNAHLNNWTYKQLHMKSTMWKPDIWHCKSSTVCLLPTLGGIGTCKTDCTFIILYKYITAKRWQPWKLNLKRT